MAKGHQRGNREQKKPKQSKSKSKAAVPASPFGATQVMPAAPIPGKKK